MQCRMRGPQEAIQWMRRDVGVPDHALLHRDGFHGCTREVADLRDERVAYPRQRHDRLKGRTKG